MGLRLLVLPEALRPNALFSRRENAIRIHSILDRLDKPAIRMIVEVVK